MALSNKGERLCPTHILSDVCDLEFDRFFDGFCDEDPSLRKATFFQIKQHFLKHMDTYRPHGSSNGSLHGSTNGSALSTSHHHTPDDQHISGITEEKDFHLPTLYHMSVKCPLDDVRDYCNQLLNLLASEKGIVMEDDDRGVDDPSSFIPANEVTPVNTPCDKTKALFTQAFLQNSRLDNLTQLFGFHPQYLTCFLRTQNILLREEGPLPFHYRHYIAIIAASRHQCAYLVHLHTAEYLRCGGDRSWLESLNGVPNKLKNLQEINRLLAHRPWLVTSQHIEKLCRAGRDCWSLSELTHAVVLMAHFHALCSAVYGCGINFELDDAAGRLLHSDGESSSDSDNENTAMGHTQLEGLVQKLKQIHDVYEGDYSEEESRRRFESECQAAEYSILEKSKSCPGFHRLCNTSHMVEQAEYTYADFVKFKETTQTFRASDYSWETHGYSIANRFYTDIGITLDDKFTVAKEFTYNTMGKSYTDVNTQDFRTAIWNYIHCLMGIRHDDYDYARVNVLLERNLKAFIKIMTCYPERLTKKDFDGVMKGFTFSEKIHVTIILLEARMQAELLYGLRALSQFMT